MQTFKINYSAMSEQTTITFTPHLRLQLVNFLPNNAGSLRESVQIKRLRDRLQFSEDEREAIDLDRRTGQFDPKKLVELDSVEVGFSESELDLLAGILVSAESDGEVPTNDDFVDLIITLEDHIEDFRDSLNE